MFDGVSRATGDARSSSSQRWRGAPPSSICGCSRIFLLRRTPRTPPRPSPNELQLLWNSVESRPSGGWPACGWVCRQRRRRPGPEQDLHRKGTGAVDRQDGKSAHIWRWLAASCAAGCVPHAPCGHGACGWRVRSQLRHAFARPRSLATLEERVEADVAPGRSCYRATGSPTRGRR